MPLSMLRECWTTRREVLMGLIYLIDPDRHLVQSIGSAIVTCQEVREHDRRLRTDPEFRPEFQQVIDLRAVRSYAVAHEEIREAACTRVFAPGVRRAIVATTDAVYGVSRILATYAEGAGQLIRVVRSVTEAAAWLGIALDLDRQYDDHGERRHSAGEIVSQYTSPNWHVSP